MVKIFLKVSFDVTRSFKPLGSVKNMVKTCVPTVEVAGDSARAAD